MISLNDLLMYWHLIFFKNRHRENDPIIYHFIVTFLIYILKSQNSFFISFFYFYFTVY